MELTQVTGFGWVVFINGFPEVKGSVYRFRVMTGGEHGSKSQDDKNQDKRFGLVFHLDS